MLPRQKHNHFLWPWRTVGDKKRHNYLAQCWNHLFLKARSFIWKFSKAIESLYFSPCDVTGWLKHRQMCLEQVSAPCQHQRQYWESMPHVKIQWGPRGTQIKRREILIRFKFVCVCLICLGVKSSKRWWSSVQTCQNFILHMIVPQFILVL